MKRIFCPCPSGSTLHGQSTFLSASLPFFSPPLPPLQPPSHAMPLPINISDMQTPSAAQRPSDSSCHCPCRGPALDMKGKIYGLRRAEGSGRMLAPFPSLMKSGKTPPVTPKGFSKSLSRARSAACSCLLAGRPDLTRRGPDVRHLALPRAWKGGYERGCYRVRTVILSPGILL